MTVTHAWEIADEDMSAYCFLSLFPDVGRLDSLTCPLLIDDRPIASQVLRPDANQLDCFVYFNFPASRYLLFFNININYAYVVIH